MNLDRVTITGADESVEPHELGKLSEEFPFVEWGILASRSKEGTPRFPSRHWVHQMMHAVGPDVRLSLHLCGHWVRQWMLGRDDFFGEWGWQVIQRFQRVQLNFHAEDHEVELTEAVDQLRRLCPKRQIILQMDGSEENAVLLRDLRNAQLDAVPLFDESGGAGEIPHFWPDPIEGVPYHGYAGGLGPKTLRSELNCIALDARGDTPVWVDMESGVRSDEDRQFALAKVRTCLEICQAWMQPSKDVWTTLAPVRPGLYWMAPPDRTERPSMLEVYQCDHPLRIRHALQGSYCYDREILCEAGINEGAEIEDLPAHWLWRPVFYPDEPR